MFHIKKKFFKKKNSILATHFFCKFKISLEKKKKPTKILTILIGCSIGKVGPQKIERAHNKAGGEHNRSVALWFRHRVQSFSWVGKIPWRRAW